MRVNGLYIEATCEQIIAELKTDLELSHGRYLFNRTKSLGSNMQFSCPFHGGGMERHPSCGMSREVKYSGNKVIEAGTVHCFTCGYNARLNEFVSDVYGRPDGGLFGNQWLKKHFASGEEQLRPKIELGLRERRKSKPISHPPIPEEELEKYRWYHPYMYKRGLTDELIEIFDIGFDKLNDSITIPVRDLQGNTVFFNRRSVSGKFHKYGEDDPKTFYLFGHYELLQNMDRFEDVSKIYITESAINCLTLWKYGIPAVALMGVGGGMQFDLLKRLPGRSLVLALDPDRAGQEAQDKLRKILERHKIVYTLNYPEEFYINKWDINDHPEILNFSDFRL